jgi:hypothetical protein
MPKQQQRVITDHPPFHESSDKLDIMQGQNVLQFTGGILHSVGFVLAKSVELSAKAGVTKAKTLGRGALSAFNRGE